MIKVWSYLLLALGKCDAVAGASCQRYLNSLPKISFGHTTFIRFFCNPSVGEEWQ